MADLKKGQSNVKIYKKAIVCMGATLTGDVTISKDTIIHPKASIIAKGGPIIIGENNIIEEYVTIINECDGDDKTKHIMVIGNKNIFEVGAVCKSRSVGNNNIMEQRSSIDSSTSISDDCVIGVSCKVTSTNQSGDHEMLPPRTVIYGENSIRRVLKDKPCNESKKIEFLRNVMPNFHKYLQPTD